MGKLFHLMVYRRTEEVVCDAYDGKSPSLNVNFFDPRDDLLPIIEGTVSQVCSFCLRAVELVQEVVVSFEFDQ